MKKYIIEEMYIDEIAKNPLFYGVSESDLKVMLKCLDAFIAEYKKGEYILFEQEDMRNIGIIIDGSIDMVKEDIWGNKTILVRMGTRELFGETFSCGADTTSLVSYRTVQNAKILFIPFDRVMHTCKLTCVFHHRLVENMVTMIAAKNRQLMNKVEVLSKRSLREKILAYLTQQATLQGNTQFTVPLGRSELADYLCADRSALTRELTNMKKEGIIDYDKNSFKLL